MGDGANSVDDRAQSGLNSSYLRQSYQGKNKNHGRPLSLYIPDQGFGRYSDAMRHLIPVRKTKKDKQKIAVDDAGFFSYMCFSWMSNYMYKAHRKGLKEDDVPQGSHLDSCEYNAQRLEHIWQQELVKYGRKEASFKRAVWCFTRTRILANMFIYTCSMIMGFLTPVLFMRRLLEYAEDPTSDIASGLTWACCLTLSEILRTVFFSWSLALSYRTGIRLRSACLTLLYKKVIRANNLPGKSLGLITNLFGNDSQRIFDVIVFGPMIVGGPFVMICGIIYTWWLLDSWALIGIMVFMIYYPIQYVISRFCGKIRERSVKISDQRVSLMREILSYIKLIKMYAWEDVFTKQLLRIRVKEHKLLQSMAYLTSLSISTAPTIPIISAIVTFLVHISTGHSLTAAQAFSILTFLTKQMKSALTLVAECYSATVDGKISYDRLQAFPLLAYFRMLNRYIAKWRNGPQVVRQALSVFREIQAFPFVALVNRNVRTSLNVLRIGAESMVEASASIKRLQAFPFLSLVNNIIRNTLNVLRIGIENMVEASTSFDRLKQFLLLEEFTVHIAKPIDSTQSVCIGNGTFTFNGATAQEKTKDDRDIRIKVGDGEVEPEKEVLNPSGHTMRTDVLSNINLNAGKGKLIGICGPIGSGKSSLLLAIMGQLRMTGGQLARDGSFAYVSQQSWILNCTLKDNILFGEKFDAKRYYQAVYSCSLTEDIKILPGGDDTEIGERGVNLSGGQRQRVALARALYSNKDIYLLDDPLSAVDANIAAHIFKEYVLNALKKNTVIFVTHQMQFLSQCSEIYMLKDGRIIEHGTHDELMENGGEYSIMVNTGAKGNAGQSGEDGTTNKTRSEANSANVSVVPSKEAIVAGSKEDGRVTIPEKQIQGSLNVDTYLSYISAAGGYIVAFLVILAFFVNIGSTAFSSWWLAIWIKEGSGNTSITVNNETIISKNLADNPNFYTYQLVYGLTIVLILVTSLIRGVTFTKATLYASRNLHNRLFYRTMHTNMRFFEGNPIGRILNVFSKDIDEVDCRLPSTLENMLQNIWIVAFAVFFICLVFPWFCLIVVLIAFVFFSISHIFRKGVRDLKRIENSTRAPVISWVIASVQGLSTIHAFGKETEFINKFCGFYDDNATAMYMCNVAMRWLAVRIDSLAVTTMGIISFMVVALHGSVVPAMAGLALTYSAHISGVFQYTIRLLSETEMRFISVEQMNRYFESMEPEELNMNNKKPPATWPNEGRIRFQNVNLRYRANLPEVLHNVKFTVQAAEKIGIVGRSGSGKSSLMAALFRLVELSTGFIKIDGVDISTVPLGVLRSKLTIIPQDPVLFSGTIRFNLDPNGDHTDETIKAALMKTKLWEFIEAQPQGLNTEITAGDSFMSAGERQLLCLTRALLRPTKILVLDEATAAVDRKTEAAVQNTIQHEFSDCTVLTIAHRLNTVLNCDKVLVLGDGKVLEFESPNVLLSNPHTEFCKLRACETQATSSAANQSATDTA